ncbi:MAG: host-nuclease inhibitor Gam family protein [Tannerellaceae bacterium]|nr:host-nuclease inhibitor Gam family protein [Tannerellaceae bacterium]
MTKKRTSVSRKQIEQDLKNYTSIDAQIQKIKTKRDEVLQKYEVKLSLLKSEQEVTLLKLQSYADTHREELFEKKKTIETPYAMMGFRAGRERIANKDGYDDNMVLAKVKKFAPDYLQIEETVSKSKLLADRKKPEIAKLYNKIGVCLKQEEIFFIKPKKS